MQDLGNMHYEMLVDEVVESQVFLFVKTMPENFKVSTPLRWCGVGKLMRKKFQTLGCLKEGGVESLSSFSFSCQLSPMHHLIATLPVSEVALLF